jgi:hypothetical protein
LNLAGASVRLLLKPSTVSSFPNWAVDAVSVYPTYRKTFDIIFERAETSSRIAQLRFRIGSGAPTMRQNLPGANGTCMLGFVSRG